jgi:hypothetical protein
MAYNCFSCHGVNQKCVNERRFTPYGDEGYCINRAIAKQDEARLKIGDLESIKLKEMFAQHLFNIGEKEKALKVLPIS